MKMNYTREEIDKFGRVDKKRLLEIAEQELNNHRKGKKVDMDKVHLACFLLSGHYV